ncbi:hypothetical protein GJAV_G00050270 [Gymnothorax javanicus]|nr:hypothetical protein GJAV_G00050270 [Gymnothorax javanicus]
MACPSRRQLGGEHGIPNTECRKFYLELNIYAFFLWEESTTLCSQSARICLSGSPRELASASRLLAEKIKLLASEQASASREDKASASEQASRVSQSEKGGPQNSGSSRGTDWQLAGSR